MSFSDCPHCWETPCACGHEYRSWTLDRLVQFQAMLGSVIAERHGEAQPQSRFDESGVDALRAELRESFLAAAAVRPGEPEIRRGSVVSFQNGCPCGNCDPDHFLGTWVSEGGVSAAGLCRCWALASEREARLDDQVLAAADAGTAFVRPEHTYAVPTCLTILSCVGFRRLPITEVVIGAFDRTA